MINLFFSTFTLYILKGMHKVTHIYEYENEIWYYRRLSRITTMNIITIFLCIVIIKFWNKSWHEILFPKCQKFMSLIFCVFTELFMIVFNFFEIKIYALGQFWKQKKLNYNLLWFFLFICLLFICHTSYICMLVFNRF